MLWHLSDTTCYVCYFHLLQVRAKSLSKHSTKMSLLFRQLVARAGRPPTDPYSDLELYSFWVGNILPTSTRDRQEMLQARSTRQRMIILLRLMMETIEQTRLSAEDAGLALNFSTGGFSPAVAAGDASAGGGSGSSGGNGTDRAAAVTSGAGDGRAGGGGAASSTTQTQGADTGEGSATSASSTDRGGGP